MKLPKVFKQKWLAALRSGEYEQGQSQLHEFGEFCCLGVACVVVGYDTSEMGDDSTIGSDFNKVPRMLRDDSHNGLIVDNLIMRNDGMDEFKGDAQTFSEIADYIEKEL